MAGGAQGLRRLRDPPSRRRWAGLPGKAHAPRGDATVVEAEMSVRWFVLGPVQPGCEQAGGPAASHQQESLVAPRGCGLPGSREPAGEGCPGVLTATLREQSR